MKMSATQIGNVRPCLKSSWCRMPVAVPSKEFSRCFHVPPDCNRTFPLVHAETNECTDTCYEKTDLARTGPTSGDAEADEEQCQASSELQVRHQLKHRCVEYGCLRWSSQEDPTSSASVRR